MSDPIRLPVESLAKVLTQEQRAALKLPSTGQLELSQIEANVWVLSAPNGQTQLDKPVPFTIKPIHQKVLKLLQSHRIPDVIEGRFENLLSSEELAAFQELRAANRIIVVKSNPKYDKGIYRESTFTTRAPVTSSTPAPSRVHAPISDKPVEEYSLMSDGFMVLRSDGAAKAASFDLSERIRAGEIKGIKSFDGFYYIIENDLLQKHTHPILGHLKEKKKLDLGDIATHANLPMLLARIVLEFAKEEGLVIEKQKNVYAFVG